MHLNGIAYDRGETQDFMGRSMENHKDMVNYLLAIFKNMLTPNRADKLDSSRLFSFAWEKLDAELNVKEDEILKMHLKSPKKLMFW